MKSRYLLFCSVVLLSGCRSPTAYQLTFAEWRLKKAQRDVLKYQDSLAKQEIRRIKKEIDLYERHLIECPLPISECFDFSEQRLRKRQNDSLFQKERAVLARIIHDNKSCSSEAQEVLDQILTLITSISNQTDHHSI